MFPPMLHSCLHRYLLPALASALCAACTIFPGSGEHAASGSIPGLLNYFQQIQRMSPQAFARERNSLTPAPQTPAEQIRLAMLLGQTHAASDLNKASGLLNAVLKSNAPEAASLRPLAQMLLVQYQERLKVEIQNEKLALQLKEGQRRNEELQEKLNAIADIENSLQSRPRSSRPTPRRSR